MEICEICERELIDGECPYCIRCTKCGSLMDSTAFCEVCDERWEPVFIGEDEDGTDFQR